jgi:signal transduction histidine kinase/CheY-like chemotaxis protein
MLSIKRSLLLLKRTYAQLVFLWLIYIVMVVACYFLVSGIVNDLLAKGADDMLTNLEARVNSDLLESETVLRSASLNIRLKIQQGAKAPETLEFMREFTDDVLKDERRVSGISGVYGVFDVYNGAYLDGAGNTASPNQLYYTDRPWYRAAVAAKGAAASTKAYIDDISGEWVITYSRQILNRRGKQLAVIAVDMPLRALGRYFAGMRLAEGGYGLMTDGEYNIILSPIAENIGQPLTVLKSPDIYKILAELNQGKNLNGYRTTNNRDGEEPVVVHSRKIENGWHIAIITPVNKYYKNIFDKGITIVTAGALMQLALSLVVLRIAAARMKADEKDKRKSSFLANMSHEIRTPMNAIIGFAELALREDIPPAAYEHIFTIKQAGANLLSIINDILDFSKIESGKLEILPSDYLLSSLVNDVVSIIKMRATYSRLRFVVNIDCNIPNALFGDEVRVRQILLNVLSNAVKYTDKGFVSFKVTGNIDENSPDTVTLVAEVSDSGKGIKKEDLGKLFKDFSQVDKMKNKGIEGTGLGLAITNNVLKAMGGSIAVNSEYGKGSTFTVSLPQKFTSSEKLARVEGGAAKSVIVYERREIYSSSVVSTIENLGVRCTLVATEFEFDEKIAGNAYDFIFTAPALYEAVKKIIAKRRSKAKVALLAEFGDAVADRDATILSMPVYSITVANMLNGVSGSSDFGAKKETFAKFIAPEAEVMVVDDTSTNLRVAEGLLAPYKLSLTLCKSGPEAIAAAQTRQFDLIFMDHMMPGMDGIEATQQIRALSKTHRTLPIIALTANAVSGAKEMFLSEGFNDFISKPIDIAKLNHVLDKWIKPEKRKQPYEVNAKNGQADGEEGPGAADIKIDGVDVEAGIALSGGNGAHYLRAVSMFYEDGFEKIGEIRRCLEIEDLQLYATHVHGLKSASASIGAKKLSELAKSLETAGKERNMTYINEHNAAFLMELEALLSSIGKVLDELKPDKGEEKTDGPEMDIEELRAELIKLKTALDGFDSAAIDAAAAALEKHLKSAHFGAAVKDITQNILIGEYDEAVEEIDRLLKETALKDTGSFEKM